MDGYMIDVQCDEQTLRIHGKNKAARIALAGEGHDAGDVIIERSAIAGIKLKRTALMGTVNGNLVVTTTDGGKFQLHFRKKQQADFEALAQDLGATV